MNLGGRLRQRDGIAGAKEVQFGLDLERGLLLRGFASLLDRLANAAGMFSIKGLLERHIQRVRLREIHRHREPRDGLQGKPVAAGGNHQREHNQPFAQALKHDGSIDAACAKSIQVLSALEKNGKERWPSACSPIGAVFNP